MRESNPPAGPVTFEDLYAEHAPLVVRLTGLFGVPESERADVAQDVWVDVIQSILLYDPSQGTPRAWLAGITRNASRDWKRTRRRRSEFSRPTDQEPPDLRAAEADIAQARRREALLAFVERAVPNEDQRTALLLHEIEGLTVEEVAMATGVKPRTARWRLEMARARLKKVAESLSDEERDRMRAVVLPLGGVEGIFRALRETQPVVTDEELAQVWDRVVERIEAEGGSIHDPLGGQATGPAPAPPRAYTFTGPGLASALAGVFVLGAVSGALAHALLSSRETVSMTAIEAEIPLPPVPTAEPRPEPAPTASARAAPSAGSSPAPAPWETEAWLLDRARKAEPAEALRLTDVHVLRFPRSMYAADREEIAIQALVKLGRTADAGERAERLVRWAPWSAPALEDLLGRSLF